MKEYVGKCEGCGKQIYCLDGFLDGNIQDDQTLLCFDCEKEMQGNTKEK